jgi:hypothetical protein
MISRQQSGAIRAAVSFRFGRFSSKDTGLLNFRFERVAANSFT